MSAATPAPGDPIRAERDRFVAFAFAAADLLLEVDDSGKISFAAGALKSLTQRNASALMGRPFTELLAESDRALVKVLLTSLKDGGRLSPILVQLANPVALNVMLGGCRLPTPHECYQITLTVLSARMPMELRAGERDAATGLLAKDDFAKLAEEKLRNSSGSYKLSLVEVGGMEAVRERADEELAEGFLAAVGRHLRAHSADGDAAGQIADGRFGVIHDGNFDASALYHQIAELANAAQIDDITVNAETVDLSTGALSETDAARTVLYAINSFSTAQRGEFTLASLADGFRHLVAETAAKVRDLRSRVATQDFNLVFQPIVALDTRAVHHYEALARFNEASTKAGGGTAGVIAFAEQLGVVAEFDLAVCERVIDLLEKLRHGATRPSIAVNISGRSLESEIFATQLDALLRDHAGITGDLLVEVTESAYIVRMPEVQRLVTSLQKRGVRVCLDDFGAGAASFHYLNALPVDFVKIDGRYVRHAFENRRDRAFLKAMAKLCHELGTATIAEMIETESQAKQIADLGIAYGQGYLFGRPSADLLTPSTPATAVADNLNRTLTAREAARAATQR
jgi:EAL domain-containing protein (putative c-di-GMP-specific phosphodiesterase class I)/GGDEF domain-containing protein